MGDSSCKPNVLAEESQFVAPKTLRKLAVTKNTCSALLPSLPARCQKRHILGPTLPSQVVSSSASQSFWINFNIKKETLGPTITLISVITCHIWHRNLSALTGPRPTWKSVLVGMSCLRYLPQLARAQKCNIANSVHLNLTTRMMQV